MAARVGQLLLLLLATLGHADDREFHTARKFLKSKDAFVRLSSQEWLVHKPSDTIVAAVRFRSAQSTGTVMRLIARDAATQEPRFELRVGVEEGRLSVQLLDGAGQSVVGAPFTQHHFDSSSEEHSVGLRLLPKERVLRYSAESNDEVVAEIRSELVVAGAQLEVLLGSDDSSSLPGCITLVSVTLGAPLSNVHTVAEYDTDECTHAQGECAARDCGKGKCLELETATCDCFGTGRAGPNCKSPPPSASLRSTMDETVVYAPLQGKDQLVHRLAIKFSFEHGDSPSSEGVLLSGEFSDGSVFTVYVVDGHGSLQITSGISLDFDFDNALPSHSLEMHLERKRSHIRLQMDDNAEKQLHVPCPPEEGETSSCLQLSLLRFGADPKTAEARRIGLNGCIWEAYADEKDVLSMYFDRDPRMAQSAASLQSCGEPVQPAAPEVDAPVPFEQPRVIGASVLALPQRLEPQKLVDAQEEAEKSEVEEKTKEEQKEETEKEERLKGGALLPPPAKKKSDRYRQPCENSVGYKCRNGASCQMNSPDDFVCSCAPGFTGTFCQFSEMPRTCAEAADFHRLPDGPTRLLVEGAEGSAPSVAQCSQGKTIVVNDMPNATVVHDRLRQHSEMHLSYRDFSPAKLIALVEQSQECTQHIRYECDKAALGFSKGKTLLTVANGRVVKRIGDVEQRCNGALCTCDAKEARGVDEGDLASPDVGVQTIVAFRDNNFADQSAAMTVGPLECSGHASAAQPIRFSAPASVLLEKEFDGSHLSLQFRTARPEGTLFTTSGHLAVNLLSPYTMAAVVEREDLAATVLVESQTKLNDTAWHQVVVEVADGQLRLSVDGATAVHTLAHEVAWGTIQLGHATKGLVGCLRSLRLGNAFLDLHAVTNHVEMNELHQSCPTKCTPGLCHNGAECIEQLENEAAYPVCACKLPEIQGGANCEIDINANSAISVHGGHLKYEDLERNPLTEQLVLSFRTDRQQGLVLFAHDHLNNFLQIHLSSETTITLTLNNNDEAFSCSVRAEPGEEFSNMEWVQLIVSHSDLGSTLSANDRACTIHQPRHLALVSIVKYEHGNPDLVRVPVGLQGPADAKPFVYTFVGGVKEKGEADGAVHLKPKYDSSLPDFLGCLRGFRVGGVVIDLRHMTRGTRPADPDLIRDGCDFGCERLHCENGGHCGVAWTDFTPSKKGTLTSCDCERTSYAGETCSQDDAISLASGHSLHTDLLGYLERYLGSDKRNSQSLKLAFKVNAQPQLKQTIASIFFKDGSIFEVLLNRNGSINVGIVRPNVNAQVVTFSGNFVDGFRHFLVAQFHSSQATAVQIDSARHDFDFSPPNLDLFDAESLVLGTPQDSRVVEAERENFNGCVSNLDIDYQVHALRLRPISALLGRSIERHDVTRLLPANSSLESLPECGRFRSPNHLPGLGPDVDFPVWETNFGRLEHKGVWIEGGEEGGSLWWILLVVILVLLAIVIIGLLVYCMCCKKKQTQPVRNKDESIPLNPPRPLISSPTPSKPNNNFKIPEPDANLDPADKDFDYIRASSPSLPKSPSLS